MPDNQPFSTSSRCTLTVTIRYPGKPILGIVTSRPDSNGVVTFTRLDDNGTPVSGATGAAVMPVR